MSSRRIQAMARLIAEMEDEIDAWYRIGAKSSEDVLSQIAVKLAGYRREFTPPTPKKETP